MTRIAWLACLITAAGTAGAAEEWSDQRFPPYIRRLTWFGERADWSHDSKRILFVEKTYGDVYEVEIAGGIIRPMTHHYIHSGYTRALYLSNGDILLSGSKTFHPDASRDARFRTPELWVLSRKLDSPPTALGEFCWEGPAASRTRLRIAWSVRHGTYPENMRRTEIWVGDIEYSSGKPRLMNERVVLDSRKVFNSILEPQNFRPPEERELIVQASYQGTEVMGLDLETGKLVNYSNAPGQYDEPEGIFPDGTHTLVECDRHNHKGGAYIDLYRLRLDGSGAYERLTWFGEKGAFKASNPVVSDDGKWIAFQVARVQEEAGVGHGIYLFNLTEAFRTPRPR